VRSSVGYVSGQQKGRPTRIRSDRACDCLVAGGPPCDQRLVRPSNGHSNCIVKMETVEDL